MADCPRARECLFYNDKMKNMTGLALMYKISFCSNQFDTCARYLVAQILGPKAVPEDLMPNQMQKAYEVIANA
jgi:hypothetical protein